MGLRSPKRERWGTVAHLAQHLCLKKGIEKTGNGKCTAKRLLWVQ